MVSLQLSNVLGVGTYGMVLRGLETKTGTHVAVKKSRVSTRVKRSLLKYEAQILHLLRGHPAIPAVHAYGRFPHFEYLAMELGGESIKTLSPTPSGTQLRTVVLLAKQLISALEHIHSHGILHRDIKRDHILTSLSDPCQVILVDFGISCPQNVLPDRKRYDPEADRKHIVGTLKWASLNAHRGFNLSWRDDLESLAYVFLFLLRGNLPWQEFGESGTLIGDTAQTRIIKSSWTGSQLAAGHPSVFGQILDDSRAMGFEQMPDYARYMRQLDELYHSCGFSDADKSFDWSPAPSVPAAVLAKFPDRKFERTTTSTPQLIPGQLVSARLLAGPTILGIVPKDELWGIEECHQKTAHCKWRPAIVLEAAADDDGHQSIKLAALVRNAALGGDSSVSIKTESIKGVVPWSSSQDMHCYVYPAAISCIVGAVEGDVKYRVQEDVLSTLQDSFAASKKDHLSTEDRSILENIEENDDTNPLLVHIKALHPDDPVDWTSSRAWLDEIAYIHKERAADNGYPWPGSTDDDDEEEEEEYSNSYYAADIADWDNRQQERDRTLTLAGLEGNLAEMEVDIPVIKEVVGHLYSGN
ncbi:uncharacterized protein FIBRA_01553 [Fibroporia radiculosa]|uniref:Protein kinase domain-containing protein n=1 Tax=Fibroporia radiculosa TaxID=599839 RepID=J4GKK7_9APHY|nr:uncharacterized protein FIBRA_01553 [Fibroporia radiculosa]CCL99535.1 predicted protein [Fibroporia radiculosa]